MHVDIARACSLLVPIFFAAITTVAKGSTSNIMSEIVALKIWHCSPVIYLRILDTLICT